MSRRFPPGAVTLPTKRVHYDRVLQLVARSPTALRWDAFLDAFQAFIRDPETGAAYGRTWVKRTVSDLETGGFVRQQTTTDHPDASADDPVTVATLWATGRSYLNDEISFDRFVWRSIKRGWILEGNAPEKIEGLERVLKVVLDAEGPIGTSEIEGQLEADYDYEFSEAGIRGYPNLLLLLDAVDRTDDGYRSLPAADSYLQRFRDSDLFRLFERWVQREGATGDLPRDTTKRDIAKYYMYRESGGWGKQTGWLKSFWREYLDPAARNGQTTTPNLKRAEQYVSADNERAALRDQIRATHGIETAQLSGLPTNILHRMAAAESPGEAARIRAASGHGMSRADLELLSDAARDEYAFPDGFSLYDWQQEAADEWFAGESDSTGRGIAQVVTGAGKTVMALEVVRRWLEDHPDGVVTVVVPTKVLMQQWLTEFVEKLNVPLEEIGWAGDGTRDSFGEGRRILVSIVNTAVKNDYLRETLAAAGNPDHLLIADECHRYTSDVFSNIFTYHRTASLGLSATPTSTFMTDETTSKPDPPTAVPEVEGTDQQLAPGDELLLDELGEIYYTLTYDEALERDLIPPFEVNYVRFELTEPEQRQYDAFSRKVSEAVSDIEGRYGNRLFQLSGGYAQKLNTIRNNTEGPTPAIGDFFEYTQKRRELVANAVARQAITLDLLEGTLDRDEKSIVFQERIEQLEQLVAPHERRGRNPRTGELASEVSSRQELYQRYPQLKDIDLAVEDLFDDPNYKPVMYHSGHSRSRWNDFAMDWFRDDGFANTMLSVKALIEGVDVPSADVGIIRVSSSSLRQRIQTLGRILRTGEGSSKRSKLYVLYAQDTVDENLFKEYDWDEQLATAEIHHLEWRTDAGESLTGEIVPTTEPLPDGENDFEPAAPPDPKDLDHGDPYEGPRRGFEFSVDADGRPFRRDDGGRKFITNDVVEDAASFVRRLKGGGTVTINEANHMVTMTEDGPVFVGIAPDPDELTYEESTGSLLAEDPDEPPDWL